MTERVIVSLIGRSKYEAYLPANLIPALLACDVCGRASRPLYYVVIARKFVCPDCVMPLPA